MSEHAQGNMVDKQLVLASTCVLGEKLGQVHH